MAHGWQFLTAEDREAILQGIRDGRALGGPYHLEFDWTDRCNVHCFFCNNDFRNRAGQELPVELIQRAVDEAIPRGLKSLRLSGGGEPLFHTKIRTLLDLIEARGLIVENLTTNGVLINEDMARRLVRMKCREIIVSLNYADPKSYAEAMQTAPRNWERVRQGLDFLRQERQAAGPGAGLRVVVQFFVSNGTQFDIPRMVEIGKSHQADLICLRNLYGVDPSHRIPEADKERVKDDLRRVLLEDSDRVEPHLHDEGLDEFYGRVMREIWAQRGLPTEPPPPANIEYCYIGFHSLAIRGGGEVFPCCMMMLDEKARALGNLHRNSLLEIWAGPQCRRFRREMERVQILGAGLDFPRQGFRYIYPVCATHYGCALSCNLCDAEFFRRAEEVNQAKRRSLRGRFLRARQRLPANLWGK